MGEVWVDIEVERGSHVKRRADGEVDFLSPVPCPFNYGSVSGITGGDGDPQDALVLGPRRLRGDRVRVEVRGVVRFVDGGCVDDKWVCADAPLTARQRASVLRFFALYAAAKRALNFARGRSGQTALLGWADP